MSTVTRERLWTGPQGAVVAGVFATAFLFAFESYAIATALPMPESLTGPYLALLGPASRGITGRRFPAQG